MNMNMMVAKKIRHPVGVVLGTIFLTILALTPITVWSAAFHADADITRNVESEYVADPAVPFNNIDVRTNEGIVTLTGSVTNLLASERATRIAETVRGVRSVVNRIKVDPLLDWGGASLSRAVDSALVYDPATDAYEINVSADDEGLVTLSGTVDSWQERELVETVTKGISGVTGIDNNIVVIAKTKRPDAEIKPEIKQRLKWDTLVDDSLIDVRVSNGEVFLSGIVGSAAEKRQAKLDAWVSGVKTVDSSDLKVAKWARDDELREQKYVERSDLEILDAVKDALLYDPRVSAFNIEVGVANGFVTLSGVVDNIQARVAAKRDARNTVGVSGVKSLIKVRPVAKIADEKIAGNVRDALLINPFTESHEINVSVKNKVAYLNGTVDSYFEKAEAENVAFLAKGVTDVRNYLAVSYPDIVIYDPYVYDWSIYDYPWYDNRVITNHKDDWEITRDINIQLFWSPFVDSDDVTVSVETGIATLTGSVDSIREYDAAEQNAFEGGAIGVVNKLRITFISEPLLIGMNH